MISIQIPGRGLLELSHLVLDYNGTIAVDGLLAPGVAERLLALKDMVGVHVLTADTYGTVRAQCEPLGVALQTFPREGAAACKAQIVSSLEGAVACVGNGFNDIQMFDLADLAIAVLDREGMCEGLLAHADVLVPGAAEALDLFLKPDRLKATLRS